MLKETDKEFINQNHKTMPVQDMAKYLKRGTVAVYNYLRANNLEVYKTPPQVKDYSHPFRQKNRILEKFLTSCRIQNKGKKYNP